MERSPTGRPRTVGMRSLRLGVYLALSLFLASGTFKPTEAEARKKSPAVSKSKRGKQSAAKSHKRAAVKKRGKKAAKSPWIKRRDRRGRTVIVDIRVPEKTRDGRPNIQSKSAIVFDLDSGETLFQKNADEQRPIASISKTFAAMVVLDRELALDGETTITDGDVRVARGGARSRLLVGRTFTNRDLLHAMMMGSDNRAVPALGRAVGLSVSELVQAMNAKARSLGLRKTSFQDPVGLSENNRSTARELVAASQAMLKYPLLRELSAKKEYVAFSSDAKPRLEIRYVNTDHVARAGKYPVLMGKTGYTDEARYCLMITAKVSNRRVSSAFLGAEGELTRFADFNRAASWIQGGGAGGSGETAQR